MKVLAVSCGSSSIKFNDLRDLLAHERDDASAARYAPTYFLMR